MNNNILIPRNIEKRKEKLRQQNIKLLSQYIIDSDIEIDESFEGISEELIKVKEIKGNVILNLNYIPSWLKHVKIYGDFDCSENNLTSLENCPQYVGGYFNINNNQLASLKGCAQYVGGSFYCENNQLTSLDGCPKYIGKNFWCFKNKIKLQLLEEIKFKGRFINE